MIRCKGLESLLEALERCTIKELEMKYFSDIKREAIKKFLKSQEKHLKKLIIESEFTFLADLKDMRLEYLDFGYSGSNQISLEFLKQHVDLRFLKLSLREFSDQTCNVIWEMKNLESLELWGRARDRSGLKDLHKLEKLKRLKVDRLTNWNFLDNMQFWAFENLEELQVDFEGASEESVQEMGRITPNLKKIKIRAYSETVNELLDILEKLESLKIKEAPWRLSGKIYPNVKRLHVMTDKLESTFPEFLEIFPNLEYLKIDCEYSNVTESVFVKLLSGLKQLKTLYMEIRSYSVVDPESALGWFQKHGKNLEDAKIFFANSEFAIEKRPRGAFCINKEDCSFPSSWMRNIF
jgi:hypothetical protein